MNANEVIDKMEEITKLTEYMEVICNRPYPRNNRHTIRTNELAAIYKEFVDLLTSTPIDVKTKSSQQKENNEKVTNFIKRHATDLYDYIYKLKKVKRKYEVGRI